MHDTTRSTDPAHHARRRRPTRSFVTTLLLVFVGAGLLSACGDDDTAGFDAADETADAAAAIDEQAEQVDDQASDLAATLREQNLGTLASAVESIDVTELVDGATFTLFAPTDDAFLSLTADETADLLTDPAMLFEVLQSHVADDTIDAADLGAMSSVTTRTGATFDVTVEGDTIMVGNATVTRADIAVSDGVIHVIDAVLMP